MDFNKYKIVYMFGADIGNVPQDKGQYVMTVWEDNILMFDVTLWRVFQLKTLYFILMW